MQSAPVVSADEAPDRVTESLFVGERPGVDRVRFHRVEERLDERVVPELPRSLHALRDPERRQPGAEGIGAVLGAAI